MPADPAAAPLEPKRATLATDLVPLGERALQGILDHVTAVGDEAETTYLEVKSSLDLGSKAGVAKVAKFLLGSANRRPHEAARHFHGYAVLVIDAQKGSARGVPRGVEPHDQAGSAHRVSSLVELTCPRRRDAGLGRARPSAVSGGGT